MNLENFDQIFTKKVFRIPNYQRGYAWEQQQIDEFWDDLYNLLPEKSHYTGMLSIKRLKKAETNDWQDICYLFDKKYVPYHIVDGQQRITTMIILISEIINYFRKKNPDKNDNEIKINNVTLDSIRKKYLSNVDPVDKEINYIFGYEKDNPSNEYFKHRIMDEPNEGEIKETFYTEKLANARRELKEKIDDLVENESIESLKTIFYKLTNNFKFNVYEISEEYDVYMAFETMNNRGKPLSYLERLKNRLFYLSTLYKDNEIPKRKKTEIGDEINKSWKNVYYYLGKSKEIKLSDNEYLQNHWMVYFPYNRTGQNAYVTYLFNNYFVQSRVLLNSKINIITNEELDDTKSDEDSLFDPDDNEIIEEDKNFLNNRLEFADIKEYISSLKALVKHYYFMLNPYDTEFESQNSNIKKYLMRLNNLGFGSFKPLIMVILYKDDIDDNDKIEALKLMERYIFIEHRLCGTLSNYKNSVFYKLARELYYGDCSIEEVLFELNKLDSLGVNNVINTDLVIPRSEKLFRNGKDGFYHWNCLKFILTEYEMHLSFGKAGDKIDRKKLFKANEKDKYSIEHIYPQTATNKYWIDRFGLLRKEEQLRLNGSLGNLLPLSMAINRDYQNDSYPDKRKGTHRVDDNGVHRGYIDGTYSEQEVGHSRNWTPDNILKRGLKIIKFMEEEWNFKFENLFVKKQFLGLQFMADEENDKNKQLHKFVVNNDDNDVFVKSLEEELFIIVGNKKYGSGFYKDGGILVKKGTKIRTDVYTNVKSTQKIIKMERKNDKIKDNRYSEDIFYDSPSKAAYVILGNNQNGWTVWKNKDGKTLDELVRKKS